MASSQQAYQDYLFQFDLYRQKNNEFKVAKNEYEKFGSLTSQTAALEKTKLMLAQRDLLLRSYLLLLKEKLNEDRGLSTTEKQLYTRLIDNEIIFLVNHSRLVELIGSLEDANRTSKQLEDHYDILQASIRQTIGGISLGQLAIIAKSYDTALADARALMNTKRSIFSPQKQSTLDRWILQITNTRSLYQQKIDSITQENAQLIGFSIYEQDRTFRNIRKSIGEARQYLVEGSGFLGELVESLRYQD